VILCKEAFDEASFKKIKDIFEAVIEISREDATSTFALNTHCIYNKKSSQELKVGEKLDSKIILNNFIEVHQNILEDLKSRLLTNENKQKFNNIVSEYKLKAKDIMLEVSQKGKDYLEDGLEKLEKVTNEELDKLNNIEIKSEIISLKEELLESYNEFREKLKKI
ncbi:MAG: hypothetical protein NWP80_02210, partial [Candidatus Gracilibacteria bacterium]|nr:hypothetical protein [Candidatus Gracilibacteria bacterium]